MLLKTKDPYQLCFSRPIILNKLQQDPKFNNLDPAAQEKLILQELSNNAAKFQEFANTIIPQIYKMKIPFFLFRILNERREHVIKFVIKNPIEGDKKDSFEASRKYSSQLLFLRILNPHFLTDLPKRPELKKWDKAEMIGQIMIQLTKVIQCLANEEAISGNGYESFGPLLSQFQAMHNAFIDQNSLPKKIG